MSKQLIPAFSLNPNKDSIASVDQRRTLAISEFFYDTIQGEGVYTGHPAAFLRVKGCVLNCSWCDTTEVWRSGDLYSFDQLFYYISESPLLGKLKTFEQHLVITGGSPLMQQYNVLDFINEFIEQFGFKPFIEIENETMIMVDKELLSIVDCWNNSPKLKTSMNTNSLNSRALEQMCKFAREGGNVWFKFVIDNIELDWEEIRWFIDEELIPKERVVLMPQGQTREEMVLNAPRVAELAYEKGVRFSNREHIILWDKKTGV